MNKIIKLEKTKSFATEANLMKVVNMLLARYPEHNDRAIIVKTEDNRWTAIFKLDLSVGGYIARYSYYGFMSI